MRRPYHTIEKNGNVNARKLTAFLCKNGQFLMPLVDLIEQCRLACDELIEVTGRAAASGTPAGGRSGVAWPAARLGDAE